MPLKQDDFFNTLHVKQELLSDSIPEWKYFIYFFIFITYEWLQFTILRLAPTPDPLPLMHQVEAWLALSTTLLGVLYLYWCNGGSNGKAFLYRYIAISIPVGIKFFVIAYFTVLAFMIVHREAVDTAHEWQALFSIAVLHVLYYIRIGYHLKSLHQQTLINAS